ncbi:hypothetical protein EIP91_008956 [Steccherinum ochraceum]|uniref:Uncharacterized protein n=1 Tax=Steccherinum ochraceum TaxID=92696 RepID=A0A4R0RXZ7_9APHY|nr:hypothetical protein EIP91_008956 [Steccherinum ochraceum]
MEAYLVVGSAENMALEKEMMPGSVTSRSGDLAETRSFEDERSNCEETSTVSPEAGGSPGALGPDADAMLASGQRYGWRWPTGPSSEPSSPLRPEGHHTVRLTSAITVSTVMNTSQRHPDTTTVEERVQACHTHAKALLAGMMELDFTGYGMNRSIYLLSRVRYTDLPALSQISDTLYHVLALVRTIQNSERAINRLPVELLGSVFTFVPASYDPGNAFFGRTQPEKHRSNLHDYIRLQHVCRHWRRVLVVHPPVMTTLILQKNLSARPPTDLLVDHCLSVSRSLPIVVYASALHGFGSIAKHSHRLKGLHLNIPANLLSSGNIEELRKLDVAAPKLEWLDFEAVDAFDVDGPLELPLLFGGETPRLRQLRLSGLSSWHASQFRGLTHLCLAGFVKPTNQPLSTLQLVVDALRQCRDLEELYFSLPDPWVAAWEEPAEGPIVTGDVLRLSKLRLVKLVDWHISQVISLLGCIRFPASASIIVAGLQLSQQVGVYHIFAENPHHFENLDGPLELTFDFNTAGMSFKSPSGSVTITTDVDSRPRAIETYEHISIFPFCASIQELVLFDCPAEDLDISWWPIFTALPSLQALRVLDPHGSFEAWILHALMYSPPTTARDAGPPVCPALREFCVSRDTELLYDNPESFLFELMLCAEYRYKHGCPFHVVRVMPNAEDALATAAEDLPAREATLQTLRAYIETVELLQG